MLERQVARPQLTQADRALLAALGQVLPEGIEKSGSSAAAARQSGFLRARLRGATVKAVMTAKERLHRRVEEFSEEEAEEALRLLDRRSDPLTALLESAPLDDESSSPEEELGAAEVRAEIARGDLISADEIRHEFASG